MASAVEDDRRPSDDADPTSAVLSLSSPDALYRFYDHAGELLYVGITGDGRSRFGAHRRGKPWWDEVTRIEIERHPNREASRRAERRAIREEKPRYNIADVQAEGPEMDAAVAAAERYRKAQAEIGAARDELHAAIKAALAAGLPIGQVARESGYDREHVRRIRDSD